MEYNKETGRKETTTRTSEPTSVSRRRTIGMGGLVGVSGLLGLSGPVDAARENTGAGDESEDENFDPAKVECFVREAVNEERAARDLDALSFDTELRDIARGHSDDMAERDSLSHEDSDGNRFPDRYEEAGYDCSANEYVGGENIAQTWYDTPVSTDERGTVHYESEYELGYGIVQQWMSSSSHRNNILATHWENQGIGVSRTEEDKVYITQNFC